MCGIYKVCASRRLDCWLRVTESVVPVAVSLVLLMGIPLGGGLPLESSFDVSKLGSCFFFFEAVHEASSCK
jgi:hypothetical protein